MTGVLAAAGHWMLSTVGGDAVCKKQLVRLELQGPCWSIA